MGLYRVGQQATKQTPQSLQCTVIRPDHTPSRARCLEPGSGSEVPLTESLSNLMSSKKGGALDYFVPTSYMSLAST